MGIGSVRVCDASEVTEMFVGLIEKGLAERSITLTSFKAEALRARGRDKVVHNAAAVDMWTTLDAVFAGFQESKELMRLLVKSGGYAPIAASASTVTKHFYVKCCVDGDVRVPILYAHVAVLVVRFEVTKARARLFRGAAAEALEADPYVFLSVPFCDPVVYAEVTAKISTTGWFYLPDEVVATFVGGGDVVGMLAVWDVAKIPPYVADVSPRLRKVFCEGLCRRGKLPGIVEPMLEDYVDVLSPPLAMLCRTDAYFPAATAAEAMVVLLAHASKKDQAFEAKAVARRRAAGVRRDWLATHERVAYARGFGTGTVCGLDIDGRFGGGDALASLRTVDSRARLPVGARCRLVSDGRDVFIDDVVDFLGYIVADTSGSILPGSFGDEDLEPYVVLRKSDGEETVALLTEIYVDDGANFQCDAVASMKRSAAVVSVDPEDDAELVCRPRKQPTPTTPDPAPASPGPADAPASRSRVDSVEMSDDSDADADNAAFEKVLDGLTRPWWARI